MFSFICKTLAVLDGGRYLGGFLHQAMFETTFIINKKGLQKKEKREQ
jgi:hypothetical protein